MPVDRITVLYFLFAATSLSKHWCESCSDVAASCLRLDGAHVFSALLSSPDGLIGGSLWLLLAPRSFTKSISRACHLLRTAARAYRYGFRLNP